MLIRYEQYYLNISRSLHGFDVNIYESMIILNASCSSEFALRSYLYIIFHNLVGWPASWWFGEEKVSFFSPFPDFVFSIRERIPNTHL